MKKYNKNKRGQWSTPMKIIIAVLVLLVSIYVYNKIVTGSTVILKCNKNGGDCVSGTCNWLTQVPALSDNAAGCKSGQLCCINITLPDTKDPNCEGKKVGDPCRTDESPLYYCGPGLVCMSRCEYCAVVWGDSTLNKVCVAADIPKFKSVNNPSATNKFVCACSKTECTDAMQKAGTCIISDYCPSTTPATYCCLTDPAKHVIPTTSTTTNSGTTTPAKTTTSTTNTAPVTINDTAPTYPSAQVTGPSIITPATTGGSYDYDFVINNAWFSADENLPATCHKEIDPVTNKRFYNALICEPNNPYSLIVYFNVSNVKKAIEVYVDPYAVINNNGIPTKLIPLGTYLGTTPESIPAQTSNIVSTTIEISPSESIEGNIWTINPGAICTTTECKNADPSKTGIIKTGNYMRITFEYSN